MGNRRTAKVAEAIREVVSTTILLELRDPRVKNVTVLSVDVPSDLRTAKVSVSVMGSDSQTRLTMDGLHAARGFLQSRIANRLNLQYTPVLSFVLDDGIKKSMEAARILRELAEQPERQQAPAEAALPPNSSSTHPTPEDAIASHDTPPGDH